MKEIVLHIEDRKVKAFLEFIKTLDYVTVEGPEKKSIEDLKSSLKQVKQMKEGKLAKQSAKGKNIPKDKSKVLEDIREAVEEVNQIKAGKKKAKPLSEFLNEL
jgi:hypothetical protein